MVGPGASVVVPLRMCVLGTAVPVVLYGGDWHWPWMLSASENAKVDGCVLLRWSPSLGASVCVEASAVLV